LLSKFGPDPTLAVALPAPALASGFFALFAVGGAGGGANPTVFYGDARCVRVCALA